MPRNYGWKQPKHPRRAPVYLAPKHALELPTAVDLRPQCPSIWDQGQEGSCTAHGTLAAVVFLLMKAAANPPMPSRQFQYYNSRLLEGTTSQDAGASCADAVAAAEKYGFCDESLDPYVMSDMTTQPAAAAYAQAKLRSVSGGVSVPQDVTSMCNVLASGNLLIIGFTVYQSFESQAVAASGLAPMPSPGEQPLGGHCVAVVGYDAAKQLFLCRNSWGAGWGLQGYFWMPFAYLTNPQLASDFWAIGAASLPAPVPSPTPTPTPAPGPTPPAPTPAPAPSGPAEADVAHDAMTAVQTYLAAVRLRYGHSLPFALPASVIDAAAKAAGAGVAQAFALTPSEHAVEAKEGCDGICACPCTCRFSD